MSDCIFCKIVAGEIPCTRVYEDDQTLVFMDIGPIIKGHMLVIPKQHHDPITETPDDVLGHLIAVVKKIAAAQKKALKCDGCNIIQNNGVCSGQAVPHLHFHVIPRFEKDGHTWNWAAKKYDDMQEMKQLAEAVASALTP
ncbi:MAG: HIT domain-containing protein [Kiritimatiellae bacterium]|nr:HIT domain-containing protein [Kiritimatiellia bacterium]MDD4734866.1 HIT domain-containing protein [Kiritimatiellia bacterium]